MQIEPVDGLGSAVGMRQELRGYNAGGEKRIFVASSFGAR